MAPSRSIRRALVATLLAGAVLGAKAAPHHQESPPQALAKRPATACAALLGTDLVPLGGPGSRVTGAAVVPRRGGAVCRIEGRLAPAVGFRVELPLAAWTGRLLQTGCGGLCGSLSIRAGAADGCPLLAAGGFATASTDMGHQGQDADWARDPGKRADFAYRGVHLTALAAKALVRAFYGRDAAHSYFDGCSDGGREALIEAQRFPADFDGILAGAPALAFTVQNSLYHGWQVRANTGPDGLALLTAPRLAVLHAGALQACDGLDGLVDGLVSAPGQCRFEPESIVCPATATDRTHCLSPAEAGAARRLYDGPRDPATAERLTQGGPLVGSELEWAGVFVPSTAREPVFSRAIAEGAMAPLIFADSRPATVDAMVFDRATFERATARHALFDATDPDLAAFQRRGGKLILFHGLADPHISPVNTVAYHEAVHQQLGEDVAEGFERLYLLPGVGHCGGGEGPSAFDLLTPLVAWVERGRAPAGVVTRTAGSHASGPPDGPGGGGRDHGPLMGPPPGPLPPSFPGPHRSRPVYPYPYIAAYTGRGSPDDARNWHQGLASRLDVPAWAGSFYFTPYAGVTANPAP